MAETANNVAQRYAVLEQAYSKEDWATVRRDGEALLGHLRQANDPRLLGLQMRLQLLLGHTHLYGFGDKAAAAGCYEAVATRSPEAALAKIAQQGLNQCREVEAEPQVETEPEVKVEPVAEPQPGPQSEPRARVEPEPQLQPEAPQVAGPAGGPASPAAPWLSTATGPTHTPAPTPATPAASTPPDPFAAAGSVPASTAQAAAAAAPWVSEAPTPQEQSPLPEVESLIPDVVEEPELIEVHQADPTLAEDVEVAWKEPAPAAGTATVSLAKEPLAEEDEELRSGLLLVRLG